MNSTTTTIYNELATSTCNPTGGGASTCSYIYIQKISTSTTRQSPQFFSGTTTSIINNETLSYQTVNTGISIIILGLIMSVVTYKLIKDLTS